MAELVAVVWIVADAFTLAECGRGAERGVARGGALKRKAPPGESGGALRGVAVRQAI